MVSKVGSVHWVIKYSHWSRLSQMEETFSHQTFVLHYRWRKLRPERRSLNPREVLVVLPPVLALSSRRVHATSVLEEIFSQSATLPVSSSGQSMSASRDKREFLCRDWRFHQQSTSSPRLSTRTNVSTPQLKELTVLPQRSQALIGASILLCLSVFNLICSN